MEKVLLALFSALIGFVFSQSLNVIKFVRRPKFKVDENSAGIYYADAGNPPHEPAELGVGFYLKNCGFNSAKSTRIFISELETAETVDGPFDESSLEFLELKRPIDLIPPDGQVVVILGIIKSDNQCLELNLENQGYSSDTAEADTFFKRVFKAKIHIHCDDVNSSTTLKLTLDLTQDSWSDDILGKIDESSHPWLGSRSLSGAA